MAKCVILREDEPDLTELVRELLEDAGYTVIHVMEIDDLLVEASRRAPCVALIDGMHSAAFDLWWVGPELQALGVPPVAFTAHLSAMAEFEADAHGFVGVITKPFETAAFVDLVDAICWEEHHERAC